MKNTFSKGFTLVELLIVITILAALAAAVVVVLNPAELLAQARDAQRLADLTTLRDSTLLILSQLPATNLCAVTTTCTTGHCTPATAPATQPFATTCTLDPDRTTAGTTGWMGIDFSLMPGGSPIAVLPVDPVNNTIHFYGFRANDMRTFKLVTRLESVRHRGAMAFDGGTRNCFCPGPTTACTPANITAMTLADATAATCFYEIGTNMAL